MMVGGSVTAGTHSTRNNPVLGTKTKASDGHNGS